MWEKPQISAKVPYLHHLDSTVVHNATKCLTPARSIVEVGIKFSVVKESNLVLLR